jgi:predicted RNA-binding protein YlqC (UPF0109 family)
VTTTEICGWLEMVIKPLVTKPESITVTEAGRSGSTLLLALHIDPVDRGAAIGRGGEAIRAIRILAGPPAGVMGFGLRSTSQRRSTANE